MKVQGIIFARWWQEVDLILHERGFVLSRMERARSHYAAGDSPARAANVLRKSMSKAEWVR